MRNILDRRDVVPEHLEYLQHINYIDYIRYNFL